MNDNSKSEFGKWRSLLWPIHAFELKKFIPMGLMLMFILYNYTIMRDVKDTLLNNEAGAESLSFVKLFLTLPGAILFMIVYTKLSNIFNRKAVFYIVMTTFIAFFSSFYWLFYEFRDVLHPSKEWVLEAATNFPRFAVPIKIVGCWTYSLYYMMSELFGTAGISILFWQFANDTVNRESGEMVRFYPRFSILGNVGLIFSGQALMYLAKLGKEGDSIDPWGKSLRYISLTMLVTGAVIMFLYYCINKFAIADPRLAPSVNKAKKKKMKMSIMESFKYVLKSKHIGYISILIVCYGITINLIECVWKNQMKEAFPIKNDYCEFMGLQSTLTGIISIAIMLIGGSIVQKFGWKFGALMTPVMLLILSMPFFAFIFYRDSFKDFIINNIGITPALFATYIGFLPAVLPKAFKYAVFDPTKEMAYLPLSREEQVRGKAGADGIGGRAGKSGGALVQNVMFFITGKGISEIGFAFMGFVLAGGIAWIWGVNKLNKSIKHLEEENEKNSLNVDNEKEVI